jgi:hypothetical protein
MRLIDRQTNRKSVWQIAWQDHLDLPHGYHKIAHYLSSNSMDMWVQIQVFDNQNRFLPIPGVGPTWWQDPQTGDVYIPAVSEKHYPLTVVILG